MPHEWLVRTRQRLPAEQQNLRGFCRALLLPFHTYLFVLSFLLFWFYHRQYVASIHHVIVAGALISGIFVGVRGVLLPWLGDLHKAAAVASLLCLLLLFYNDLRQAVAEAGHALHLSVAGRLRFDLGLLCLLFGAAAFWVVRTCRPLARASQALDVFSCTLVAMIAAQILLFKPAPPAISRVPELANLSQIPVSTNTARDIYLLVADSRTSSAALNRYWNYDDSSFTSALKQLGFRCDPNATSRYSSTPQCISTLLNMEAPLFPPRLQPQRELSYLARSIRDSRVGDFLTRQGYEIVNLSLFDLQDQPRYYAHLDEGASYSFIFTATLPGTLWRDHLNRGHLKQLNEDLISELTQLPARASGRPRFVYAHLMMPHYPYLYDRHGNLKPPVHSPNEIEDPAAFLEQLIYTDQLILQTVKTILAKSRIPPVIIIRGDHGFRFLKPPDRANEAHQLFSAAYFPEGGPAGLPANPSHSMVFRDVLNRYFGTSIPLENGATN